MEIPGEDQRTGPRPPVERAGNDGQRALLPSDHAGATSIGEELLPRMPRPIRRPLKSVINLMLGVIRSLAKGHPNIFLYECGSAAPPFGPADPLEINLWSKRVVSCSEVATF